MTDKYGFTNDIKKINENEIVNYYNLEQEAYTYARNFFEKICTLDFDTVYNGILPLYIYNQQEETLKAVLNDTSEIRGGFQLAGKKQAVIKVGIQPYYSKLRPSTKQTIRHEIIHYYLWLCDFPWRDNDLEFWCMCYIFNSGTYACLSPENKEKYEVFTKYFDKYFKDIKTAANKVALYSVLKRLNKASSAFEAENIINDLIREMNTLFHYKGWEIE